jgi:hypothetical protein
MRLLQAELLTSHAAAAACLQLLDGRVSLHEVEVLQPAPAASHPYLSPQQHPDLLAEAVSTSNRKAVLQHRTAAAAAALAVSSWAAVASNECLLTHKH